MAASSLSVVPPSSLSFITERSHSYSSSSSFVIGGNHKRFTSLHSWHSISPSRLNARVSAKRGAGPVITASGDYYVTLGVPNSASSKEIKAAYRRLARQVLHLVQFLDFFPIIFFCFAFVDCYELGYDEWVFFLSTRIVGKYLEFNAEFDCFYKKNYLWTFSHQTENVDDKLIINFVAFYLIT